MPGHEVRPFEVARGGEAYQVLEVLLGDIVCLLDSAVSEASNHPGFLVHDCPQEADMSERLYREFFLTAAEAADGSATMALSRFSSLLRRRRRLLRRSEAKKL